MKISVIIPTYNRANVLGRTLASVFNQTHPASEVLVIDDGSSDGTEHLIATQFPSCRYLKQENQGVSHARNQGIRAARSEWLAFVDSDDEWRADKLATQVAALQANPEYRLCHTEEIWIRNGVRVNAMKKHAKRGGYIFHHCLPLCVISPSSVLLHRALFDTIDLFDETLPACEDYDLWLRICARHPVLFLDSPLIVKYGGHKDQLSKRHWGMDRFRIRALEKVIDSTELSPSDRSAAIDMLILKSGIFAQGASKRRKHEQARIYFAKQAQYQALRDRQHMPV